jgi:hypothetical protein
LGLHFCSIAPRLPYSFLFLLQHQTWLEPKIP